MYGHLCGKSALVSEHERIAGGVGQGAGKIRPVRKDGAVRSDNGTSIDPTFTAGAGQWVVQNSCYDLETTLVEKKRC